MHGKTAGRKAGKNEKLIGQIRKKLAKGKSTAEIAEELEEDVETIEQFLR